MSPTRRGRVVLGALIAALLVGGGAAAVLALGGKAGTPSATGNPSSGPSGSPSTSAPPPPPPICPLTGVQLATGTVPQRPALAIKVENLPAARPQTGLSWADIVYEEPVEGGITRFIAVYQCQDASRVEPVRSARMTDINVLVQFGKPLFGYAGGVPKVVNAVRAAGIHDWRRTTAIRTAWPRTTSTPARRLCTRPGRDSSSPWLPTPSSSTGRHPRAPRR
jgi:hypothetical protein